VQAFVEKVPAEVVAAGPADEPVENSSIFHGFLVLPPNQMSSYANDPETSFATRTAPADFNLWWNNTINYTHNCRHKYNFWL